jgi:hypothetical protein
VNLTYDQLNGGYTEYTAVIEGSGGVDHSAVKDRGATPMSGDYIWHFTTSGGGTPLP